MMMVYDEEDGCSTNYQPAIHPPVPSIHPPSLLISDETRETEKDILIIIATLAVLRGRKGCGTM